MKRKFCLETSNKYIIVFVTEQSDHKKCGGCNWETSMFYGLGVSKRDAQKSFSNIEGYGKGLCSECMCDLIMKEGMWLNENL